MNQGSEAAEQLVRLLTLRIADEVRPDVRRIRRIAARPEVTPVPGAPAAIPGVFASHGELIATLDPRPLLGLPAGDDDSRAFVVIAQEGDLTAGLLVDCVD